MLMGTAITSANRDLTRVPIMVGSVPNSSLTGSQVVPVMKPNPNLFIASQDPRKSSITSKADIAMTNSAEMRARL